MLLRCTKLLTKPISLQLGIFRKKSLPRFGDSLRLAKSSKPMDSDAFRTYGKKMVDFIADYWDTIRDRKPLPPVSPGYMRSLLPHAAPEHPESWEAIFMDMEKIVMSGTTHWAHPHFLAYFPVGLSYPSVMGDMLSAGLGCVGFTWQSSPACTELEMMTMDWLAKALHLPKDFLYETSGPGAGLILSSASESVLMALIAARTRICARPNGTTLSQMKQKKIPRLVAYCSDQAHSSVEKAAVLGSVRVRRLDTYRHNRYGLLGCTLQENIERDIREGLIPFFVCATVGSTSVCAYDRLLEIGPVCQRYGNWLHVDAAYAGVAAICPEYKHLLNGVEYADSFCTNPHKLMMVNLDCSAMWFKDGIEMEMAFRVDAVYLSYKFAYLVPDFRNWQISLSRRFRSLKLWFVMRTFGITGIQQHIRNMCKRAEEFALLLTRDRRFELFTAPSLGLVCFRLKGSNALNEQLYTLINDDRRIHLTPSTVQGTFFLRLVVCYSETSTADVQFVWDVIREMADVAIHSKNIDICNGWG